MGTHCEEKQSFLQLPETLAELRSQLADVGLSFINQLLLQGQYPVAWGHWRLIFILGGGTALQGSGWGSGHLGRTLPARGHLPRVMQTPGSPCLLLERMLGCENVLSKAPPPPPGIKMNSYEVLPPAVDRKTLLKCESSVLPSSPSWGMGGEQGPGCLDFPSSTFLQVKAPERGQLSLALVLETSKGLDL